MINWLRIPQHHDLKSQSRQKWLNLVCLKDVLLCLFSTYPAHQPRVEEVDPNQQPPPQEEAEQEEEEGEEEEQQPASDLDGNEDNSDDTEVSVFICEIFVMSRFQSHPAFCCLHFSVLHGGSLGDRCNYVPVRLLDWVPFRYCRG